MDLRLLDVMEAGVEIDELLVQLIELVVEVDGEPWKSSFMMVAVEAIVA